MIHGISERRTRGRQHGFTTVEWIVGIVVLALVVAVVVVAVVPGGDDKEAAAPAADLQALTAAQEKYCTSEGRYASEQELVDKGLIAAASPKYQIRTFAGGACGEAAGEQSGYAVGYAEPNGGAGASVDNLNLVSFAGFGVPTPFRGQRGPGAVMAMLTFDTLVWKDATGQPVPWLATAWETSPDGLQWTFTLRDKVAWQDKNATHPYVTPSDVKFTVGKFKSAVQANPAVQVGAKAYLSFIAAVNTAAEDPALGPNQVRFVLNKPIATFMTGIAQVLPVLPAHIWSTVPDTGNPSVMTVGDAAGEQWAFQGSGPYILDSHPYDATTGAEQYRANPDYWAGEPYVKKLTFVNVDNSVLALQTGRIDAGGLAGYGGIGAEESVTDEAVAQVSDLAHLQGPGNWNRTLQFNPLKGAPYNDYRFRQAVAYAIDRDQMVTQILNDRGEVASSGGLANSSAWLAEDLPAYDDDAQHSKAKALLAEAGFANTDGDPELEFKGADFNPNLYFGTVVFSQAPVDFVVQKLAAIGIKVNPVGEQQTPKSDQRGQSGDYEMIISAWAGHSNDPDTMRSRLAHSVTTNPDGTVRSAAFQNVYGWNGAASSPATDDKGGATTKADLFNKLAGEQLVTLDPAARRAKVQKMQELVAFDVPYIPLYIPDSLLYFQDRFTPWYFTPGATPQGPNTANNKQVFVTGMQFGSIDPGLDF